MFRVFVVILLLSFFKVKSQSVDTYTGRAIVNLPLTQISAFDLSASVQVAHHGNALRVDEAEGSAGMGWNVVAGGAIQREVRGLPDEYSKAGDLRKGWLNASTQASAVQSFNSTSNDDLGNCTDEVNDWNFINSLAYNFDTEPDIYTVSAPGISAQFIFDINGAIRLIPYQDITIVKNSNTSFSIWSSSGIKYDFEAVETTTRESVKNNNLNVKYYKAQYLLYESPITFTSTWHLTKVTSLLTGTVVLYSYLNAPDEFISFDAAGNTISGYRIFSFISQHQSKTKEVFSHKDIIRPLFLTEIQLKSYRVNLEWGGSLLLSVKTTETESGDTKVIKLNYTKVQNLNKLNNVFEYKHFLNSIDQENSCIRLPSYRFTYEGVSSGMYMAWNNGWGKDIYGFYNGGDKFKNEASAECVPKIYYYQNESGPRRFRTRPIPGVSATMELPGDHMFVSSIDVKTGALKSIQYPNGGSAIFEYEPNYYYDLSTNENIVGPGVRVKALKTNAGSLGSQKPFGNSNDYVVKEYQYTSNINNNSSGKILYPPSYAFSRGDSIFRSKDDFGFGTFVVYDKVKEITPGFGYVVYEFDVPLTFPESGATYAKVVRKPGSSCLIGSLKNGSYQMPFAPLRDQSFQRGMLLKYSEYSQNNLLIKQTRYNYSVINANLSIKALRYEAFEDQSGNDLFFFSLYEVPYGQSKLLNTKTDVFIGQSGPNDSIKTSTSYTYNSKNYLANTTVNYADGASESITTKYACDYTLVNPSSSDDQAVAIKELQNLYRGSQVIEQYKSLTNPLASPRIVAGQLTKFKKVGSFVDPIEMYSLKNTSSFNPSSVTTGNNQVFTFDNQDYQLVSTLEYKNGILTNTNDLAKNLKGIHYSINTSLTLASFLYAKAENCLYDGFDHYSSNGFAVSGMDYAEGKTGNKSLIFYPNITLSKQIVKGESSYRIAFWVKSTSSATISVKSYAGQLPLNLVYSNIGQWQYLEGLLSTQLAPTSFNLQINTNSEVKIDDILALPQSAIFSGNVYSPLSGVTHSIDDFGNSTVIRYDEMGRKVSVLDKDRNLVERIEYGQKDRVPLELNATFTSNVSDFIAGSVITFTANEFSCIQGTNYNWVFTDYVGNQTVANGTSVQKTFAKHGEYIVSLTASNSNYPSTTFSERICVYPPASSVNIQVSPTTTVYHCNVNNDRDKIFTASLTGLPPNNTYTPIFTWYITDTSGNWQTVGNFVGDASAVGNQLFYKSPSYDYSVKCVVSNPGFSNTDSVCNNPSLLGNAIVVIDYINNSPCQ